MSEGFRLSPQQRRLWLLGAGAEGSPYRCRLAVPVDPALDPGSPGALAAAVRSVVARHEILRTRFELTPGLDLPVQVVTDAEGTEDAAAPDGLAVELRDGELHLSLPALLGDVRSLGILAGEILTAAAGVEADAAEPPLQLADIAEWQNHLLESPETADAVAGWAAVWRERGIVEQLDWPLPLEEPRSGAPFDPDSVPVPLPAGLSGSVRGLLLPAWTIVLARSAGRDEVLVGALSEGRDYEDLLGAVGPFARYLPVHVRLRPGMTLAELGAAVARETEDAVRRQEHFSWDAVDPARPAGFFPACFETGDQGVVDRFGLSLACHQEDEEACGELRLCLRFDRSRFRPEAVERLAERLTACLEAMASAVAERPGTPIDELELLGPAERLQLTREWSGTAIDPPEACLHRRIEEQADRTPDRPAVEDDQDWLTYRELDERANRLAHHLRALGVGLETPVVLAVERSARAVVALLAVLKAGGTYVPLDPGQPAERLRLLLEDTGAPLILADRRTPAVFPEARVVDLDADAEAIAARPASRPEGGALPGSLAYAIYTSGSTGRPKRVAVEHRSPLALFAGLEAAVLRPHLPEDDGPDDGPLRVSLNAPLIFDASVQQLVFLTAGHTLRIVPDEVRADGPALVRFLREQALDVFDGTPSQIRLLVAAGLLDGPAPSVFLVAGEAVDDALWSALAGSEGSSFYNIYGPTEATVDATARRITPGDRPGIGRPLLGYEAFLLDPLLRPVPAGAAGEICLGGAGLARGYADRPEITAGRFVPHPFSGRPGARLYRTGDLARYRDQGELEFLGRLDHQVKIRGFRIELGEIESALLGHPWVAECAVLAREDRLVAYVRPAPEAPRSWSETQAGLYRSLAERLPAYMVPAAFVPLPDLPRLPNGKLDRRALPDPSEIRIGDGELLAPRTAVEEILAGVWCELLRVDRVGLGDDFFALGGHSLLATRLASRVRDLFRVEIKVRSLFESPTLGAFAAQVAAAQRAGGTSGAPPLRAGDRTDRAPLSHGQQRLWLHQQLEPASTAYNLPMALRLEGVLDAAALAAAFRELVCRHESLRTAFPAVSAGAAGAATGGEPVQAVLSPPDRVLPLVDLAALGERAEPEARRLLGEDSRRPFHLAAEPALRALLLRLGPEDHGLGVTLHHIVSDAWSMDVLTRELVELYSAIREGRPAALAELPVQYSDYAGWQRAWLQGPLLDEQLAWWRRRLEGAPPLIRLPTDRPRPPIQTFRGAQLGFELPPELSERLRGLGRREGCTPFMTLFAAFLVLLHQASGEEDLVVGSPVSGRTWREIEGLIGFFVNTLPLRADLSGDPAFRELMARVRHTALAAFAHEHLPFDRLIGELRLKRSLSHGALFQVGFTFQAVQGEAPSIPGLAVRPFRLGTETTQFDLNLTVIDTPGLSGGLQYSTDLFDEATVAGLAERYRQILELAAEDPDLALSGLRERMAEAERRQWDALHAELEQASAKGFQGRKRQAVTAPGRP